MEGKATVVLVHILTVSDLLVRSLVRSSRSAKTTLLFSVVIVLVLRG